MKRIQHQDENEHFLSYGNKHRRCNEWGDVGRHYDDILLQRMTLGQDLQKDILEIHEGLQQAMESFYSLRFSLGKIKGRNERSRVARRDPEWPENISRPAFEMNGNNEGRLRPTAAANTPSPPYPPPEGHRSTAALYHGEANNIDDSNRIGHPVVTCPLPFANATGSVTYFGRCDEKLEILLLESLSILDVPTMWSIGTANITPVRQWCEAAQQMHRHNLDQWDVITTHFREVIGSSLFLFASAFQSPSGRLLTINEAVSAIQNGSLDCNNSADAYKFQRLREEMFPSKVRISYTLPKRIGGRKVDVMDVICMWTKGYGDIPPIGSWTPAQKLRQQSKISRWKKLVSIYTDKCGGNKDEFCRRFSTSSGELLSVSAVLRKYDVEIALRGGIYQETHVDDEEIQDAQYDDTPNSSGVISSIHAHLL